MKNEKLTKQKNTQPDDFLLVGIGASAGGIQALRELFAGLPDNTGMAYVVIVHLSQEHESSLHNILQTQTGMPVVQVQEAVKVQPNHVYVIPPARHLEMVDGVIQTTDPERIQGKRVPIDRFFRSLSQMYGRRALGIVLSGTGTDGTLGLKHIKGRNGFAMVQDPADAEYDSMPRSAISTGLIDVVLPVADMPKKLEFVRDTTHRYHLLDGDESKTAQEIKGVEALRELLNFLNQRTGHDFTNYKRPTLLRRVARHLQIHEVDNIQDYLEILRNRPNEVYSLIKNLLINVTNFFRDKEAFEVLEKEIIPRLFEDKAPGQEIRIWSAGCASGEEAYSLAILLSEHAATLAHPPKVQIFASDVDDEAIAEARDGRYTEAVATDISPERLKRFFVKSGNFYRVKKEIREMVLFAPHNILRDPPFSRIDLVACRNVLIYLNRDTQDKVMRIFHFALGEKGYLFLGSSETAESATNLFSPFDKKNRIYLRRETDKGKSVLPQMPIVGRWQAKLPEISSTQPQPRSPSFWELHARLLEPYTPPSLLVNEEYNILHLSEKAGRYLQFVGGDLTANLLKVVHPALRSDLRASLFAARKQESMDESRPVRIKFNGSESMVSMVVQPVDTPQSARGFLLVLFKETPIEPLLADKKAPLPEDKAMKTVVRQLEEELEHTKNHLQQIVEQYETSVEELKASNEEFQAINEELRSASEELETSKEELQSINEELITVNLELKDKIEELSRSNSDMQNLMASTDIGTIFLDRNHNIKRFTPHLYEFFNLIPSDIGRPLEHLKHNFLYDNFSKDAEIVLRSLQPIEREVKDQKGRYFILRFTPYRTADDKIDGVVISFVDITERKMMEVAKYFWASLVESTKDAILTVNFDGNITSWNKAAEDLYNYPAAEVIGKPLSGLAMPEALLAVLENAERIKRGETVEMYDTVVNTGKHGRPIDLEIVLSPVKDGPDRIIGISVIARDITERRQAEQELQESEKRFRAIVSQTTVGILRTDLAGNIIFANAKLCEMLGYLEDELIGKKVWDITHQEDAEKYRQLFGQLVEDGTPFYQEERIFPKHGPMIWASFSASAIFDTAGKPQSTVAVILDITERKEAEEKLHEKNKELQQFAYVTSHDLQEPLTTIHSVISMIENEHQFPKELLQYLHFIKDSARRLAKLIADLLNHSRIGTQGQLQEVDFLKAVQAVLTDMKATLKSKEAIVEVGLLPVLKAYPTEIRLLLQNLISNAVKFHRKDMAPQVFISAIPENTHWHFIVEDNGIGIEEKFQGRIFDVFQRLHSDDEYEGTGIGLAQCKKIVDLHDGKIWLESKPGDGSKFHFTIKKQA